MTDVTRQEFEAIVTGLTSALGDLKNALQTGFEKQGQQISDLNKAKQTSWQLVASLCAIGVVVVGAVANTHSVTTSLERIVAALGPDLADAKTRLRGQETALEGVIAENEAQHVSIADVINQRTDYESRMDAGRCHACGSDDLDFPPVGYWPLEKIGMAKAPSPSGNGH